MGVLVLGERESTQYGHNRFRTAFVQNGKNVTLHYFKHNAVFHAFVGEPPVAFMVDHISGTVMGDGMENLRPLPRPLNSRPLANDMERVESRRNYTGFLLGVHYNSTDGYFESKLQSNLDISTFSMRVDETCKYVFT